jgi:hypothetical protein
MAMQAETLIEMSITPQPTDTAYCWHKVLKQASVRLVQPFPMRQPIFGMIFTES